MKKQNFLALVLYLFLALAPFQSDAGGLFATASSGGGGGGGGTPGGSSGQTQYNNAGSFGGYTMSGDCALVTSTGVITCTKTNNVSYAPSATTDTTTYTNITGNGNISTSGTAATAAHTITSNSATALAVGQNGITNPALQVDASTATSVTGLAITSKASGAGVTLTAISSAASESFSISAKGASGQLTLSASNGVNLNNGSTANSNGFIFSPFAYTAGVNAHTLYTQPADTGLTASSEAPAVKFNLSANIRTHATGALATQRELLITQPTTAFAAASALTSTGALGIDGPPICGTNATCTNSSGLTVGAGSALTNTTNGYGINITAPSGATNNYAALYTGNTNVNGVRESTVGSAIASAGTIAPVNGIQHVTGTAAIATITLPAGMTSTIGGCLTLVADGAWTTTTAGNIFATMTATAGTPYQACYEGTKWYIK